MAAGDATAADVPGKYDVVINGKGYVLLDSLEPSIPFRTHRAIYGQTQPFVERQNVSNSYGDNTQDFFPSIRQRDRSLGEQQKYFRANQDGRYWAGSNIDVTIPGQVTLSTQAPALTMAAAVNEGAREPSGTDVTNMIVVSSATNLYRIDSVGTVTDLGAHGLGAAPRRFGVASDGESTYLTTSAAGTVGVRRWSGAAFTTFSATPADSIAFLNNTLYGLNGTTNSLVRWDTAGVQTTLFTWKSSIGNANGVLVSKIEPYGGKLLILLQYGQDVGSELWIYDGTSPQRLEVFPPNFYAHDLEVLYGVAYVSGSFIRPASSTTVYMKPAIHFFDGSQLGKLWEANSYGASAIAAGNLTVGPHPAIGVSEGRLIFTDETTGNVMAYNPALGGVSTIATVATGGTSTRIVTVATHIVLMRSSTTANYYPSATYNTSGYVISSLIDFDSSLAKIFRGVTIEFDAASDGNGGSVDVAYQLNGLSGSWTSLATGVTSGTEVLFPAGISAHSVSIKVTLNKGTSTAGPVLRSLSVRGAPVMPIYPRGEYILDCTNTEEAPRILRDGSYHPLTGYSQVQNLITARNSLTPISITDKANGTFAGFVDVNDPQGFDIYEIHPADDDLEKAGSYVVRLTVRGV